MINVPAHVAGEAPAGPKTGKVFRFVRTSRGIFPFKDLEREEIQKSSKAEKAESKQIRNEEKFITENDLIPLPFNVNALITLMENCTYYDKCCRQIGKDVTGQGWDITPAEEVIPEDGTETEKGDGTDPETEAQIKTARTFIKNPSLDDLEEIETIMEKCEIDSESIGWASLEVSRNSLGLVNGIFHIPSHTIRIHKSGKKYCQLWGTRKRWFKAFGEAEDIDQDSGEPCGKTSSKKANELIFWNEYFPSSRYYGAPPIYPAVGSIKGMIGIRDYNLSFFENYGVPAAIVTLTGDWDEEGAKNISDFIDNEIKGSNHAHKTLVINPPDGGQITWEPLIAEVKEGHFKLYQLSLRNEILVCYAMPPYRIGINEVGSLSGSTATESSRIYVDSTVNPRKYKTARIITKILQKGLGLNLVEFYWAELDVRDKTEIMDRCVKAFGIGVMNRKQIAEELSIDPPDDENAETFYIASNYVPVADATVGAAASGREPDIAALAAKVDKFILEMESKGGSQNADDHLHNSPADEPLDE